MQPYRYVPRRIAMRLVLATSMLMGCLSSVEGQAPFKHLTVADGLHSNQVRQIIELPNGQILAVTEGMFNLYDGRTFRPCTCNLDSVYTLPSFGGHSFLWQGDSLLWIKDFYSLYMYDTRTREFRYDYDVRLKEDIIRDFAHENGDSLTKARVEMLNPCRPFFDSLVNGTTLQGEWLQAYTTDRQGGQWLGMQSGGILYIQPTRPLARTIPIGIDDVFLRMVPLSQTLMLAGGEKGVYIYDTQRKQVVQTIDTGNVACSDISVDSDGRIWISSMKYLLCYDNGNLSRYDKWNVEGLVHHHVRFTYPLADGRMLLCNIIHHLGYFDTDKMRFKLLNDQLPELERYRTIIAACPTHRDDEVLICTQNGLFILNVKNDKIRTIDAVEKFNRYTRKINCAIKDRRGRIWIGTQNGLLLMQGNEVRRIAQDEGLSNTCIRSIVEDNYGNVWMGTSNGINRIYTEGKELYVLPLGASDGAPRVEMKERGTCLMPDGKVYFATQEGLICIPSDALADNPVSLPVRIVGLSVSGREIFPDENGLTLDHRDNYLEIQFSALHYAAPERTRYRYRLQGVDTDWIYANGEDGVAEAHYHALAPGEYTFCVQAAVDHYEWGPSTIQTFVIRPPLWLAWWAKAIYAIILVAALAYLTHRYWQRRKVQIESENDEKVNRLFELRDEARHKFAQSINITPEKIAVNKDEEAFIAKIMEAIEKNIDNIDYTVDQLAIDTGVSRTSLYKRMKQMLGITPNEFIRSVKMKFAARLLTETNTPITEISLMVGFQTPRYFSQCFKRVFGVLPTEYRGTGEDDVKSSQPSDTESR